MLYANTDEGSSALWVLDGNGVVVDNISYSIADRAPILAQINEHYGTSFTGWSDNEIALSLGNTLPNWNAYEKIETTIYIKAVYNQGAYTFGFLSNDKIFQWEMFSESIAKLANTEGVVQSNTIQQAQGYWENVLKAKLQARWDVESYVVDVDATLNPGATVPNWQNYEIVE